MTARPPRRATWLLFAVFAIGLAGLVYYLTIRFPEALEGREAQIDFARLVVLMTVLGSAFLLGRHLPLTTVVRNAVTWLAIVLFLVLGYSHRHSIIAVKDRIVGELLPHQARRAPDGGLSILRSSDGHFHLEALVNGVPIRFMVDTGASDIVLRPEDAKRLGFRLGELAFTRLYRTANGTVRGAPVTLRSLTVEDVRLEDVGASVNEAPMSQSLLGMSFLERFESYEVRDGVLTLRR